MDDSLIIVVRGKEHLVQKYLRTCYPPDCTSEGKLRGATIVPMLETAEHAVQNCKVVAVHHNKNIHARIALNP
jgi:hypothetical protein